MTEDYKEQLLNYITNSITQETGQEELIINREPDITNQLGKFLEDTFGLPVFKPMGLLFFENTSKFIVYGNWEDRGDLKLHGALIIFDENINPVDCIMFYNNAYLPKIEMLKVDEDDYIYGIDNAYTSIGGSITNHYRFIMLDNIISTYSTTGEYQLKYRKTYNLPNSYQKMNFEVVDDKYNNRLFKQSGGASYLFIGQNRNNSNRLSIITLKINVGEENEWKIYAYSSSYSNSIFRAFCIWTEDSLNLKIGVFNSTNYCEFSFNGTTITRTLNTQVMTTAGNGLGIEICDFDDTYLIVQKVQVEYYKYNFTTSSLDTIYTIDLDTPSINTFNQNNLVFISAQEYNAGDDNYTNYISIIKGEEIYNYSLTMDDYLWLFILKNNFNLYQLFLATADYDEDDSTTYNLTIDYNANNYNGQPYIDYNSLIGYKGRLYSNNRLIFARNLYNKTSLNNQTISTLQVPNTMLNDIDIDMQTLLGITNLELVENNDTIQKNVYETLFLNFIDTINVIDEDTSTNFPIASNYINTNINIGTQINSNTSSVGKVRINFEDSSVKVFNITWNTIDDTHKSTTFSIYAEKEIQSLDFLSNDENTIYCTKDIDTIEGNFYTITQYLRVE